jgi:hypothetical protein
LIDKLHNSYDVIILAVAQQDFISLYFNELKLESSSVLLDNKTFLDSKIVNARLQIKILFRKRMKIISHRGYWIKKVEKNTEISFQRSFSLGFGTETDIRDYNGNLVISHDIPTSDSISLDAFFQLYNGSNSTYPLALNIKADGLQKKLIELLEKYSISNYFIFDMSIPDLKVSIGFGLKTFVRLSEYETDLPFYESIKGIWLDSFNSIWYTSATIKRHLDEGKFVCIVSPELHNRNHSDHWEFLVNNDIHKMDNVLMCTDFPILAKEYFRYEK